MSESTLPVGGRTLPVTRVHTLVIGSGAAGLNAAVQLRSMGVNDIRIVTEGLQMGTSINTGSDKQTYYKLSLCGEDLDAPRLMAKNYFDGGMHGDLALVEASLSGQAFMHLVQLGVPFPQDRYGQFVGYKTDHDPRQRATSIGPYTSRDMCRALIREVERLGIPIDEGMNVVRLLAVGQGSGRRAAGAIALDSTASPRVYLAENTVFATGGPGGLYKTSVYPEVHTGGIGLALLAGASAQSIPESQYGLASIRFRWNVSGTYMQVVPRFISTDADGVSNPEEFLRPYFQNTGEMNSMVFLKGYQWPFDVRKVGGGSSWVDIFVYIESVLRGRRVFLDFRANPEGFSFSELSNEARTYLENSKALQATPLMRLRHMNPGAIALYRDHGIDLETEPLEIAVCAQHNNGGLAGNHWWESVNIKHLFPVGEVNGSHGIARPGGAALNSGQVGGIRAAMYIANRYNKWTLDEAEAIREAKTTAENVLKQLADCATAKTAWIDERDELQTRMSRTGAHIRRLKDLEAAVTEARIQWARLRDVGCRGETASDQIEALRNLPLCFAHLVYLEAILTAVRSGAGSRGSSMVLTLEGTPCHPNLGHAWNYQPENPAFHSMILETTAEDGLIHSHWVPQRPIPESDTWFETAWAVFRSGEIFD